MGQPLPDSLVYQHLAQLGKALSTPNRLEILDLLAKGEQPVEMIAVEVAISHKLASAHVKVLKNAHLVKARREGKHIFYSLSGPNVAQLGMSLRQVAQAHLSELQMALKKMASEPNQLISLTREELIARAQRGEVVILDVRPASEFDAAHLPHARSLPLAKLSRRLAELPVDQDIVAYCRGPHCLMSDEAVDLLTAYGFRATKIADGVDEWRNAGLPVVMRSKKQG